MIVVTKGDVEGTGRCRCFVLRKQHAARDAEGLTRSDDGFIEVLAVVVGPVPQFDGADVPLLRVEAEIVVEAPPVVAKAGFNLETGHVWLQAARLVRDPDLGTHEGLAVRVKGFWETPRQLEEGTDDQRIWILCIKLHAGVEVAHGKVFSAGGHLRHRQTVLAWREGDEDRRVIVVKITAEGELNLLDVIPSVSIGEADLCRVRHAGVKGGLVIVTDDGGVGRIEFRLEFLAHGVRHQVCRPVRRHLAGSCATERRTEVFRAHRAATHRHNVVLCVLSTDEEGHALAVDQHRVIDAGFEDVEATRPNLGRGHRLQFVFLGLRQSIEVVVGASNGLTRLASKPVMEADLVRWVHGVLNHQADRLSGGRVEFHAVHWVGGKHQRRVPIERQANGVVAWVGEH